MVNELLAGEKLPEIDKKTNVVTDPEGGTQENSSETEIGKELGEKLAKSDAAGTATPVKAGNTSPGIFTTVPVGTGPGREAPSANS